MNEWDVIIFHTFPVLSGVNMRIIECDPLGGISLRAFLISNTPFGSSGEQHNCRKEH